MLNNYEINIIAPNIKEGGGLELLEYLLIHLEKEYKNVDVLVYIDSSIKNITQTENRTVVPVSGMVKKISLFSKKIDNAIYFGNLPPLVRSFNSVVYCQNSFLIVDFMSLFRQSVFCLFRYGLQQIYIKYFIKNVDSVACQNKQMQIGFIEKYHYDNVEILPFYRLCPKPNKSTQKIYDFCYISSGYPHKNHSLLFDALEILGSKGAAFTIIVTIENSRPDLIKKLNYINNISDIQIINLGPVSKESVCDIYGKTKCLIYPSIQESFGLPLIEAVEMGLDVIASDLLYIHDIISTPFLFDPTGVSSCVEVIEKYLNSSSKCKCKNLTANKVDLLIDKFLD
jgi:glycosyltransferase involved in cell wall biosynthesis